MKYAALVAIPLLALGLAACGGGPRPGGDFGLPRMRPSDTGRPSASPPSRPHAPPVTNVAPPHGPAGPLTVARIGSYTDALEVELRRHVHGPGIVVARQGDAITVVVPNALLFSGDGGVNGDDVLEPLAAVLRAYAHTTVVVGGFTDTIGAPDKNMAVSQKRARQIAGALAHEGVAGNRLSSQGYGETHLRIRTGDDKAEPRNRRIEFLITPRPG